MTNPKQEYILSFVDRCLADARTGKLYLTKCDRQQLQKTFALAGHDVKRPFKDEESLLRAYFESLDEIDVFMVYEHLRLHEAGHEDPLENLSRLTNLSRLEYLVLRIIVKVNFLKGDTDRLDAWILKHAGERYINQTGRIAFDDEERMLELDRLLEDHIRTTPRPVCMKP